MAIDINKPIKTMDYSKYLKLPDSDNIKNKQIIKQKLLETQDILYLLNAEGENLEIDDYFGKYILPYYVVDSANPEVHNYLCYETSFMDIPRDNQLYKNMQMIFYICINKKNAIEPTSGIARHDLIATLIEREINWSSCFGMQCSIISNRPSTTDLNYVTRTLVFQCTTPRNIVRTDDDTRIVNYEVWD